MFHKQCSDSTEFKQSTMQSHDVEIFWGDHVLQLLQNGDSDAAMDFINTNEALLRTWQHGFCLKIFSIKNCKELWLVLAAKCPVDEIVFDLVDVSNDLDELPFFDAVLPGYLILLQRDPKMKYLDWFLGMIKTRLKIVFDAAYVGTAFDCIGTAVGFFNPLSDRVRCLLVAELLNLYNEETFKSNAVRILDKVLPDPFFLLPYIESGLKTDKSLKVKYNPILDKSIVKIQTVCSYFGHRVLNCDFPLIYSMKFLLMSSLPIIHELLMKDEFVNLGLKIFVQFWENDVKFTIKDLSPDFRKTISALNNIMIYNQTKETRDEAFRLFNAMLNSLDNKGLYHMLWNYRKLVNHPSTISYLMSQIKKSFMNPNNEYFKGKRLFDVLKLYGSIDKGINLLDEHVRIVTTLNFFWYLIGCSKRNTLQLQDSFLEFMESYCKTVEELISKARLEQQESLRELEKGKNDCSTSVSLYDTSLPELSNQQKIDSILSVRNVIDVVEHNLQALNTYWKQ